MARPLLVPDFTRGAASGILLMMFEVLQHRTFRVLFAAQVAALLGTGFLTVALALLAYDLADDGAALILGTIFTIKMVAYVGIAPLAGALAGRVPRRGLLVSLDLLRALAALTFPFVDTVLQAYILVFILQAASAAFTPTFQATIPDVLPSERQYTRALSLSRLAYDLENIASPALAAAVLLFFPGDALFFGTLAGFLISAALIVRLRLPSPARGTEDGFGKRVTRGLEIYFRTPRLKGLLALNLAAAAGGAMVLVNTIVLVRATLGRAEEDVALALGAFGGGSMAAALILPRLLDRAGDRPVMLAGAAGLATGLTVFAAAASVAGLSWPGLLLAWTALGFAYSAVLTPSGRLLRRSAAPEDRAAVFAAQFAASHACWLLTYPLAGFLMTRGNLVLAASGLALLAALGLVLAVRIWPAGDPEILAHDHPDLPPDHPHLQGRGPHVHAFRIDGLHREWPRQG